MIFSEIFSIAGEGTYGRNQVRLVIKSKNREGKLTLPKEDMSRSLKFFPSFFSYVWAWDCCT